DYYGCLKRLPTKLLRLFVHAYQAYLFNRFLSQRLVQMDEPHIPNSQKSRAKQA
ncbi:MAG TPA: tRNA pseudouridine(13) synthase TruD, partial [Candidatus Bathyarchaeota archaeon]|nr:tRNA pseudouridine(13) synthase TruD [Candidatus Bathyarchaeota archaeon]